MTNFDSSSRFGNELPAEATLIAELERRSARAKEDRSVEAVRERCKRLRGFIREAWPIVEPATRYVHNWHIDAVAEHLEAITRGDINRLVINEPPGMLKSMEIGVFWPAHEWGPAELPHYRYIGTSYRDEYAKRDSRRMRDIVGSDWFRLHWPRVVLERGGETSFSNTLKGSRDAVPFGSLTSGRGDRLLIDDPHSTETAESEMERNRTIRIFREDAQNRLNDLARSAIVIVMQRLHEQDVSGVAMALELGYTMLMLPMEFEPERRCITYIKGRQFFEDPRSYDGELLFPERFPRAEVNRLKKALGNYGTASQLQQRPVPRQGRMFQRGWFEFVAGAPADCRWMRWWDIADTEQQISSPDPAWTAGLKLGFSPRTRDCYVGHVERLREEAPAIRRAIKTTAVRDGIDCHVGIPQDPGGAGKGRALDMVRMLPGFVVHTERETGSKIVRAEPAQSYAEAGGIKIVRGPADRPEPDWIEPFLAEIEKFPAAKDKDQVDALANAFAYLVGESVFNELELNIAVEARRIPGHWARAFAFELDEERFAAVWAAWDRTADVVYLHDEYRVTRTELAVHKEALVRRGAWIPGLFNLVGGGRRKQQGIHIADRLMDQLTIFTVEAKDDEATGIEEMKGRLSTNRLKIFEHLVGWLGEYRHYRREDGEAKAAGGDHLMRATKLLMAHIENVAMSEAAWAALGDEREDDRKGDEITGY